MVSTIKNGNVFVVDALKAQVLKELKVGSKPSFITVSDSENLAYVANRGAKAISVIDLISMETKEDIPVKQMAGLNDTPKRIVCILRSLG